MSKRLQVLLDDTELRDIRRIAKSKRMTVAEWVRQVLRAARRGEPTGDPAKKLAAIQHARNLISHTSHSKFERSGPDQAYHLLHGPLSWMSSVGAKEGVSLAAMVNARRCARRGI